MLWVSRRTRRTRDDPSQKEERVGGVIGILIVSVASFSVFFLLKKDGAPFFSFPVFILFFLLPSGEEGRPPSFSLLSLSFFQMEEDLRVYLANWLDGPHVHSERERERDTSRLLLFNLPGKPSHSPCLVFSSDLSFFPSGANCLPLVFLSSFVRLPLCSRYTRAGTPI